MYLNPKRMVTILVISPLVLDHVMRLLFSLVQPVYYLRTRQYSRSIPTPPFMVNFQGCLFRSYPGKYQTLLDTGDGRAYRRIRKSVGQSFFTFFHVQLLTHCVFFWFQHFSIYELRNG